MTGSAFAFGHDELRTTQLRGGGRPRDPRVRALLCSLEAWLPAALAWERAMNAAAPLVLLESIRGATVEDWESETRLAIGAALTHAPAMHGYVATPADLERAIDAWLGSPRTR